MTPLSKPLGFEPQVVRISEGWFWMGCSPSESAGRDDEKPRHKVWVDTFGISDRQTTNYNYAHFLTATGHPEPPTWDHPEFNDPEQPVVSVSWLDATAYCDWLSRATNKTFRLPTEAEWERAARGGVEDSLYPWGDCLPSEITDYAARWKTGPEAVARYPATGFGLFNMGDNVHEWCSDWYDAGYYAVSPERNPKGPLSSSRKASRGGSWRHQIKVTRTAARSSIPAEFKYADYGFRVACDES